MAKKTNDNTINFLYVNKNENKKKNFKKKQNINVPKKTVPKDEIINLDNEIIIGLTPKPKQEKAKKQEPKKQEPKKQQPKKVIKQKKKSKKAIVRIKILKWTSLVILAIGIIIAFMLSPVFNVLQINVIGNEKIASEEIINLSQIQLNQNTFKINAKDVINKIQSNTYIENVNVTRELPGIVKIEVKERTPQYIIQIANGNAYIDSKGYILEIASEQLQLPIITGYTTSIENIIDFENTKKLSDEDCEKIEKLNEIVEAAKNNNFLEYITSIDISNSEDIQLYLMQEGKIAYFGDATNANLRILYLKEIVEQEKGKEGEAFINGNINTAKPKPYFREKI